MPRVSCTASSPNDIASLGNRRRAWPATARPRAGCSPPSSSGSAAPDDILLALQRRRAAADAEAPVDVRAARQVQAQRCQRRVPLTAWPARGHSVAGADAGARPGQSAARRRPASIRLPDVAGARALLWVAPAGRSRPPCPRWRAAWRWLEVRSGVPRITLPRPSSSCRRCSTSNWWAASNFQKGCYPGQEIVARSQYRGTLKRRTFLSIAARRWRRARRSSTARPRPAGRHGGAGRVVARGGTRAGRSEDRGPRTRQLRVGSPRLRVRGRPALFVAGPNACSWCPAARRSPAVRLASGGRRCRAAAQAAALHRLAMRGARACRRLPGRLPLADATLMRDHVMETSVRAEA